MNTNEIQVKEPFYFNTTKLSGARLRKAIRKAKNQNEVVMLIFKNENPLLTPSQVLSKFPKPKPPLTSVRRSMTVLSKLGKLEKCEYQRMGIYGSPEHYWKKII